MIVSPTELNQKLGSEHLVLLDASPQSNVSGLQTEYPGKFIPGARMIDLKKNFSCTKTDLPNMLPLATEFQSACQELGINKESEIVVYDNIGIYTSPRIWWMFNAMGHSSISVLDGGLPAWISSGFKVVDHPITQWEKGNFLSNPQSGWIKDLGQVFQNLSTPEFKLIDARSKGRFTGEKPEPRAGLSSGHIPGSYNVPWKTVLDGGHFKSPSRLQEIFDQIPAGTKELVFSCGSGLTACIVGMAYKSISDQNLIIFDGSWTEWASHENLPIIRANH